MVRRLNLNSLSSVLDNRQVRVGNSNTVHTGNLEVLKGFCFYCPWEYGRKLDTPNCCFNHYIGMPKRLGQEKSLFEYQRQWFNALQNNKMVYLLKCTSAGATEFMIRYISWLCLRDDALKGSQIVIATGPRIETSIAIIDRMKHLFLDNGLVSVFNTKQTEIELNGIKTTAVPSDHLDTARGIPNVSLFYSDETAFYSKKEQENLRDVSERYIAKSHPQIVYISTPNYPGDVMNQISLEKDSMYTRLYTDYSICLRDGMFTPEEIELQKQSVSFEREYNLKFLGGVGDIYNIADIEMVTQLYDLSEDIITDRNYPCFMSIDPAFGSSDFAVMICQYYDHKLQVVYCENITRPLFSDMVKLTHQLIQRFPSLVKIFVDGSAVSFIKEVRATIGEYPHYDRLLKNKPELADIWIYSDPKEPLVCPISFSMKSKQMTQHSYEVLSKNMIRIHPKFDKLLIGLRTAESKGEWDYNKTTSSTSQYQDLIDYYRMISLALVNK